MSSSSPHESNKAASSQSSGVNLSSLPAELQTTIVARACSHQRTVDLDYKTALSLTLVSRSMYALVTPILYRNVQLTRPSVLSDFLRAVSADPALGKLVRSLHVGPRQHLPDRWWPLGNLMGERAIMTSLEDEDVLPQWCCPRRRWPLRSAKVASRRDAAVLRAVNAAQRSFGVDLTHPRHALSGHDVGSLQWFIGVMEVGAALDLYLMEMRRLEDRARWMVPPWAGEWYSTHGPNDVGEPCPDYPSLLITTASSVSSDTGPRSVFVLPYAKLLDHLAQRGSSTDWFDHPLIYARSQLKVLDFDWAAQAHGSRLLFNNARGYRPHEADERVLNEGRFNKAFELASVAFPHRIDAVPFLDVSISLDVALARTSTVGGLISMVRSLLTLTPTLDNLFLAGFAQQVACELAAGPLPLRLLHLGPLTFRHEGSLDISFRQVRCCQLEKIFLEGCELYERKIASIVACAGSKVVFWSMRSPDLTLATLSKVIAALLQALSVQSSIAIEAATDEAPVSRRILIYLDLETNSYAELWRDMPAEIDAKLQEEGREVMARNGYLVACVAPPFSAKQEQRWDNADVAVTAAYLGMSGEWEECVREGTWWATPSPTRPIWERARG